MNLRSTGRRVIMIDTPGLDDLGGNGDEWNKLKIFEQLTNVKNINCVLIIFKNGEIMGKALREVVKTYKEMLNTKKEDELFCIVHTHCDYNLVEGGKIVICDEIDDTIFKMNKEKRLISEDQ